DHAYKRCQVQGRASWELAIDPPGPDTSEYPRRVHQEGTARPSDAGRTAGLRAARSEVAALTLKHIQQRDGRWCIVDLVGKHGRVRTIPMPTWVKVAIDTWTLAAGLVEGHVLRPVNRADQTQGEQVSEKVVWQLL